MTIRVFVVDDEPIAIRGLSRLLQIEEDIEIVGSCGDGASAIEAISQFQPDLVFLDIKMPKLNGFDVVEAIGLEKMPPVIFVTAFDEFAVRAFDVHAIDYLLKPIDPKRFQIAIERAKRKFISADNTFNRRIISALNELGLSSLTRWSKRLAIRTTGRINLIEVTSIERIESAGNYVEIYTGQKPLLMRETLSNLEERLDPDYFVRISRSSLVNIEYVRELQPMFNGDFVVILKDGTQVSGSRRFRDKLNELIR